MTTDISLDIASLSARLAARELRPADVAETVLRRAQCWSDHGIWIRPPDAEGLLIEARALERRFAAAPRLPPLYGIPFAVKDNIDVAGLPTTAGCPGFAYQPAGDAAVVARLRAAGALPVGKTNMDQFATGLVGVRSPHGPTRNAFDRRYIAGGSSSGSAVAVAAGLVSFALGTDTAGSGRVPAAFNHIVGLKPTRGHVSNRGTVPACRSLDCVSVFALCCADAAAVLDVAGGFDGDDPFARRAPATAPALADGFRFAVPDSAELWFDGDSEAQRLFQASAEALATAGGTPVTVSIEPLLEAARLLYEGPWIAERHAALGSFLEQHPEAVDPVVAGVIGAAAGYTAADAYRAFYRLRELRRQAAAIWRRADVLLVPTTPTIYTIDAVLAEPVALNTRLGHYTNFLNLMDLCGLSVPAGFRADGLPLGVTLCAPAWCEALLCALGQRLHAARTHLAGATGLGLPPALEAPRPAPDTVDLAVVGAHLEGQPLHHQLADRGARLLARTRTAADYRLYALAGSEPAKPGLVRVCGGGAAIEVEVYRLSTTAFGEFTAGVPAPLAIGSLELEDGSRVKGFVCEPWALDQAREITAYGGWRAYLAASPVATPIHSTEV